MAVSTKPWRCWTPWKAPAPRCFAVEPKCFSGAFQALKCGLGARLHRCREAINDCDAAVVVNASAKAFKIRARAQAALENWAEAKIHADR